MVFRPLFRKIFLTVTGLRLWTQHILFVVLTFGGRFGIHLGHSLPCFSCPYVSGCGGGCYLMVLQWNWRGLQMSAANMMSVMGLDALFRLGIFILLILLLGKFWCGWICPFGTFQDWLALLRKRLGIREAGFSWRTRDRLQWIKYILLAYLLIVPLLIAHAGLHPDFTLPFCQICPAKPLMPLFAGITRHLSIDTTNAVTMSFTVLSLVIAGGMLVGMFFKDRFFCLFCPMLVLIHWTRAITPIRFRKRTDACLGCGNCHRNCPMDIRDVYEEKGWNVNTGKTKTGETDTGANVMSEDCILCMNCMESCPTDRAITLSYGKWRLFSSSRAYVTRRFFLFSGASLKKGGRNE